MRAFDRKIFRDISTHKAEVIAVVAIVILGAMIPTALLFSNLTMRDYFSDIYRTTNYQDFLVELQSAPPDVAARVSSLGNVDSVQGTYMREALASIGESDLTLEVVSVPDRGRPAVNDLIVESGDYLQGGGRGQAMAEFHLADEYALKPGDEITLYVDSRREALSFTGSVMSPEYLRLTSPTREFITDPARFGVIFVTESEAARLFGTGGAINGVAVSVEDQELIDSTMRQSEELLEPYGIVSLARGEDTPTAAWLDFDLNNMRTLGLFFALLILVVASLAIYALMTRMVVTQQQQIGAARAVGYDRRAVLRHYLGFGAVLGTIGGLLGILVGYFFCRFFIDELTRGFGIPRPDTIPFHWVIALLVLLVAELFAVLGAALPARRSARMRPADAMRVEAELSLQQVRTPRAAKPGRRWLPTWLHLSLRNLFRSRKRVLITFLGMMFALAALITTSGYVDCVDYAVDKHLGGVMKWDASALFADPQAPQVLDGISGIEGVEAAEPMLTAPALLSHGDESIDIQLQAYRRDTAFHQSYPTGGSEAAPGPGEMVVSRSTSGSIGLEVGDSVEVSTAAGSIPLEVAGISSEPFGTTGYVDLEYVQGIVGDVFNTALVSVESGRQSGVAESLRGLAGVARVTTRSDIRGIIDELLGIIKSFINIVYAMMLAIAFAIVFAMVTVNTMERRREIATMRTLGAGRSRVFATLTAETFTIGLLAVIPALALGYFQEWFLITKLTEVKLFAIDVYMSPTKAALMVALFLVATVLAGLLPMWRMWHLDLARVVKERAG